MRDKLIEIFNAKEYRPLDVEGLKIVLDIKDSDSFKELVKLLNELESEYIISRSNKDRYDLLNNNGIYVGVLDLKEAGFGFVMVDIEDMKDIFVGRNKLNGAQNKDKVLVKVERVKHDSKKEGIILEVIERKIAQIVGLYRSKNKHAFVIPDDKTIKLKLNVEPNKTKGAINDHKVICKITKYINQQEALVEVLGIIGHISDPGIDVLSIVYKHELDPVFPASVITQAEKIPSDVSDADLEGRVDLRNEQIVTIDGDDALDLDDAINVKVLENGNYMLGVHIADVSHYVQEGTDIDIEAYKRATSVYLVDRVIPMLPRRLSNGICSLNPLVDRLTVSCNMEINSDGDVVKYDIYPSVINSKARMTYNDVNSIYSGDKNVINAYSEFLNMFYDMRRLQKILHSRRDKRGAVNFETDEAKVICNKQGKPIEIKLRDRGLSERVIEEFMLCANETVAEHFHWLEVPFLYRVHEEPNQEKLVRLLTLVKNLGYSIKGSKDGIHQTQLQKLLTLIKDSPAEKPINTMMLRSMAKARYCEKNLGHYGLAAKYYAHFTSPIRRYPDLIVHRLIRGYLFDKLMNEEHLLHNNILLTEQAQHTSYMERVAVGCERDVDDMKKAEYMGGFIGVDFEGIISSITAFGIYVELPNTCEGLVHVMELDTDYFEFDPANLIMIGRRTKKIYKLGQKVTVKVISVNKSLGQVDFKFVNN